MASQQSGAGKKQRTNLSKRGHSCPLTPILYRHQDCNPNTCKLGLIENCERQTLLGLQNNQGVECHRKAACDQLELNLNKNKAKQQNPSTKKTAGQPEKYKESLLVNTEQSIETAKNNDELSKSRKRRLRKQKLLVSITPSQPLPIKPIPAPDKAPQPKPVSRTIPHPASTPAAYHHPPTPRASGSGDISKTPSKDQRKRPDKSVSSRSKSIKTKTLIDQSKADIIKTLEEKALSSLLQTLAPLTNTSPKKEKPPPPPPVFSFHDKWNNHTSNSKIHDDGVFYFGETKRQLEKLTTNLTEDCSSNSLAKPVFGQNNSSQIFTGAKPISENCVSSFKFSSLGNSRSDSLPLLKQQWSEPVTVTQHMPNEIINSDTSLPLSGVDNLLKGHFSSAQRDLVQLPVSETNPNTHSVNGSPITNLPSPHLASCKNSLFRTTICSDKFPGDRNFSIGSTLASEVELNCSKANLLSIGSTLASDVELNCSKANLLSIGTTSEVESNCNKANILSIGTTLASGVELNSSKANLLPVGNQSQNMKPGDTVKSTKTREEVMLEREAKKAAKIAAKAKHKNPKDCKEDVSSKQVSSVTGSKSSKIINPGPEKEYPIHCEGETQKSEMLQTSQSIIVSKKINVEAVNVDKKILTLNSDSQETSLKSKAELKAERRAKQEAQRAAKTLGVNLEPLAKGKHVNLGQEKKQNKTEPINQTNEKKSEVAKVSIRPKSKLFIHLYQEKSHLLSNQKLQTGNLHPAIIRLGIQYNTRVVAGSNARCVSLLHALKQMVNDYTTPSEKEFSRGLEEELGPMTAYLNQCRPLAVSMTNALRHIKRTLTQLPNSIRDVEARRKICDVIDTYIHEQIDVAGKAICNTVKQKIANGDVILTYSCSSLVYKILVDSHNSGTKFRVVVVDGLPWREGKEMLRRLVEKGISCTYVLITAASFIMREVSKVLLGAHALLANGYVMSRAGSSQVALLAHCYNVPVLVCCETHKFSERVQTDAFVYNELGELCCDKDKGKSRVQPNLTPLSLAYDVTPPDLVSAVVTELAVLPCTSVPVILRIKPSESVM